MRDYSPVAYGDAIRSNLISSLEHSCDDFGGDRVNLSGLIAVFVTDGLDSGYCRSPRPIIVKVQSVSNKDIVGSLGTWARCIASSSSSSLESIDASSNAKFLREVYSRSSLSRDTKYTLMSFVFDRVEGAFAERDLKTVDDILYLYEPSQSIDIVSVGLLRATFRANKRLKSWDACLARVVKHLNDSGKDWRRQLRGLLGVNDSIVLAANSTVL